MPSHPTPPLLAALATSVPRYTSYPSVPQWSSEPAPSALADAVRSLEDPAAVYVHVPFCWEQCSYCACNMVVARRQTAGERYLRAMARQIAALPLGEAAHPVRRIHLGGGTPTWLSPQQLTTLLGLVRERFEPEPGAELSVEVHPGVTTPAHLDALAAAGFNRLSIGVQSADPAVLEAIGRKQSPEAVRAVANGARDRGMWGLNLDLVVGLPLQTQDTLSRTLDLVEELRPDRLAIYGYAHMPWLRKNQAVIDSLALPGPVERMELALEAGRRLERAGWRAIGLDHYALPHDPLVRAADLGRLSRDFMGHTDRAAPLIGLGPSAISEIGPHYVQQPSSLGAWYRAVEGEQPLPVARTYRSSADDLLRRDAIRSLMCGLSVRWSDLDERHGLDAAAALADARERLEPWRELGAVAMDSQGVRVGPSWRPLLKNLAACFDPSLGASKPPVWRVAPAQEAR